MKTRTCNPTQEIDAPGNGKAFATDILIVEDNVDLAQTFRVLLEMAGHRVTVAHRGDLAVDAASALRLDAICCDIGLPGLDGYEVARRLREMANHRHTFLIAITGYGDRKSHEMALSAGFDVHLTKPVPPQRLLEMLRSLPRRDTPVREAEPHASSGET